MFKFLSNFDQFSWYSLFAFILREMLTNVLNDRFMSYF